MTQVLAKESVQLSTTGYAVAPGQMICVFTRIRLKHWWHLPVAYVRWYRVLRRQRYQGLRRSLFSLQSPSAFYTISIWDDPIAISRFGNDRRHVAAVRWTLTHASEIWASEWRLHALSPRTRWDGEELIPRRAP